MKARPFHILFATYSTLSFKELIYVASSKIKNMKAEKVWDRIDPRDAQIAALTTLVQMLTKGKSSNAAYTA